MTHGDAEKYILDLNNQNFGGYSGWRLPTLEEAMALMEPQEKDDGLHIDKVFDKKQDWIWTSSKPSPGVAWNVDFSYGFCNSNDVDTNLFNCVRAVRSGQS